MATNAERIALTKDELSDFTRDVRVLLLAAMAMVIGAAGAGTAYVLVNLIGVITNLAFYARFSSAFVSPTASVFGLWIVPVPVAGGLIVGLMARYGSEKIHGHGIPEALEAILIGGSRVEARVALLKPLASAISIGTGSPSIVRRPLVMRDRTSKSLSRTRLEPAQLIVPSPPATARRGRPGNGWTAFRVSLARRPSATRPNPTPSADYSPRRFAPSHSSQRANTASTPWKGCAYAMSWTQIPRPFRRACW